MKPLHLLCFITLLFFATDALAKKAELRFRAAGNERIQLIMNGRLINRIPAEEIHVQERPGVHRVLVRVYSRRGRLKFEHQEQLHVRPHSMNAFVLESHPYRGSRLLKLHEVVAPERPVLRKPKAPARYNPGTSLIEDEAFFRLKDALERQPTDEARMKVARKGLKHRLLYAGDVEELLYLFRFEGSRLAFASWAYDRVIDPENYEEVYKAFRSDASIIQLRNYLRHKY